MIVAVVLQPTGRNHEHSHVLQHVGGRGELMMGARLGAIDLNGRALKRPSKYYSRRHHAVNGVAMINTPPATASGTDKCPVTHRHQPPATAGGTDMARRPADLFHLFHLFHSGGETKQKDTS